MALRPGSCPPAFQSDHPLVFAHRGGAALAPENTLIAFENGLAHGADGMELDVHLSRDGVPVVIHDGTVDRTTSGTGSVASFTAAELAALDAGHRFARDGGYPFRDRGHGVPTLEAVLARWPAARVIIEMKNGTPALGTAAVEVVRRVGAQSRVCLGSFQQEALDAVRVLAPDVATGASLPEARRALRRSWVRWPFRPPRPYVAFQVPEWSGRTRVVSPAFVRQVHREGQVVQVWVVDRESDARRLLDMGVDGLISDRPDVIVPFRNRRAAASPPNPRT
ncbi:MAG: glycerophosphodiester phosphodiesterase [Acidobacteria bacterium]|nr:glycerophosphodiester phosphodiesterase [Acidobacteriota bacterium]